MYQSLAWATSLVVMTVVAIVFLYFVASARTRADDGAHTASARWRSGIFWVLSIAFVPLIGYSLTDMPYPLPGNASANPIVVQAVGRQWSWTLSQDHFPVGRTIEFHVTADDVNHGFGIYDSHLRLVTQTQAMPGFTNVLRHTFTTPGTYRVLCLEYCGLAHYAMMTEFTVEAAAASPTPEVRHD